MFAQLFKQRDMILRPLAESMPRHVITLPQKRDYLYALLDGYPRVLVCHFTSHKMKVNDYSFRKGLMRSLHDTSIIGSLLTDNIATNLIYQDTVSAMTL